MTATTPALPRGVRASRVYHGRGIRKEFATVSKEDGTEPESGGELLRWAKETQRNIDFIINQQAQFNADMQQLRESQERCEERWTRADERWSRTEEGIRALLAIAQLHDGQITALEEAQAQTDRQMAETDRRMAETDERINALVNTVERIIGERRNGGERREGLG
jgi:chromosome segregation ATPase